MDILARIKCRVTWPVAYVENLDKIVIAQYPVLDQSIF